MSVYLDFRDAIQRDGEDVIRARYGNLFQMYERITDEDPYQVPMRIYPAVHYTMGGLWVNYDLESTVPGLFVLGEANFSDHGANRLGASALMQGLADGYFVVPYTVGGHLAGRTLPAVDTGHEAFRQAEQDARQRLRALLEVGGRRSVDHFHRQLGLIMWNKCGMARNEAGLTSALDEIRGLRQEYREDVRVLGSGDTLNQALERAGRVNDFFELAELMVRDALHRTESCGGHFREESQTEENEAKRDDEHFSYVAAWATDGNGHWSLYKEPLEFEHVKLTSRSYK
jgi:succinate dehydrogenase / fumarate reductase flavoprotein subunit